jgi:hypothetical protein
MGILLSWRTPASKQDLNDYLAKLQNACLYAVYLNGYLTELQIAGLYAVPEWVSRRVAKYRLLRHI